MKLKTQEVHYAPHYLELVVIVYALQKWRHFLLGKPFELKIDHQGLKYILNQPHLNASQRRWLEFLNEYDFEIEYIEGKENMVADALRRRRHLMNIATFKTSFKEQVMEGHKYDPWYMR